MGGLSTRYRFSTTRGNARATDLIVFVLVVGEELGWRGYAFPKLTEKFSARTASLILGVLWGVWHLPTFVIASMPQYGRPFGAFLVMTVSYSVLLGWAFLHTRGSVLIATQFHGAINLSQGFFLGGMDPAMQYWLLALVYGVAAVVVALALGPDLARHGVSPPTTESTGCVDRFVSGETRTGQSSRPVGSPLTDLQCVGFGHYWPGTRGNGEMARARGLGQGVVEGGQRRCGDHGGIKGTTVRQLQPGFCPQRRQPQRFALGEVGDLDTDCLDVAEHLLATASSYTADEHFSEIQRMHE